MNTRSRKFEGKLVGRRVPEAPPTGTRSVLPGAAQGVVVSVNTVEGIVRSSLSGKLSSDPGVRYGDGTYYLPTLNEVEYILKESQLDRKKWTEERFDCDDFAYVLKGEMSVHAYDTGNIRYGLCVGMVWGDFGWVLGYHAVNWFIASDLVLRWIEPQSDTIYEAKECVGNIGLLIV